VGLPGAYDVAAEACRFGVAPLREGAMDMAKNNAETGVYRVTEVIGTSKVSWEDAAKNAVETAAKSLRDLRIAEVSKLDDMNP
jgi:flavin-binding protein dodecin